MIFIDADAVEIPPAWPARAAAATTRLVEAKDAAARRRILKRASSSTLWAELGPALARLSCDKCWYCEVRQVRSDMPIDHYRPKARPVESPNHPGYWWLAFQPANFRFSCTYCNSRRVDSIHNTAGGKQSHFPLVDENTRSKSRTGKLDREQPILLDPTIKADPGLLFFDLEGEAGPHPRLCPEASVSHKRAKESVELFHLNHQGIREQRKRLNRTLGRVFLRALANIEGYVAGESASTNAFNEALNELGRAISEHAELSAAARAYLKGKRGESDQAQILVEHLGL